MTVVSAFLVPGSPLPYLRPDNPPWRPIAEGYEAAAQRLKASDPDVVIAYSTQWIAVLDALWQTRGRVQGVHVDENWHDLGDLPFDLAVDTPLAMACVAGCRSIGVNAKSVDYDDFPIDTGTIVMSALLNKQRTPLVITANNLYHDPAATERLAKLAVDQAASQGKRVALVGIGALSGSIFRDEIDIATDKIRDAADDAWNRRMLDLMVAGAVDELRQCAPAFAQEARADMGFKHFFWLLGGLGGGFAGAKLHAYGPVYGSGAAIVELIPS